MVVLVMVVLVFLSLAGFSSGGSSVSVTVDGPGLMAVATAGRDRAGRQIVVAGRHCEDGDRKGAASASRSPIALVEELWALVEEL